MPTSRLEARFNLEAERLALAEGRLEASVVKCPICLATFGRQDLLAGRLTEEHPISRKVGGRMVTITCKVCNSTQGSRLDKHVVKAARTRDAFAGHGTLRSTVRIGDAKFEAEVDLKPDVMETNTIAAIEKASHPKQIQAGVQHLVSGVQELKLSISFGYNQDKLLLGILRAAYRGVFRNHGYTYALSPSVTAVRRQITGEDEPDIHLGQIVTEIQTPKISLRDGFREIDLHPSTGEPIHLVLVQTKLILTTTYAVLLPHAGPAMENLLERLAAMPGALKGRTISVPVVMGRV